MQAFQHDIRSTNEIYHLPLINLVARIIGAERNLSGGQHALNAIQLADVQTTDMDLSVSSEISRDFKWRPAVSRKFCPLSDSLRLNGMS